MRGRIFFCRVIGDFFFFRQNESVEYFKSCEVNRNFYFVSFLFSLKNSKKIKGDKGGEF